MVRYAECWTRLAVAAGIAKQWFDGVTGQRATPQSIKGHVARQPTSSVAEQDQLSHGPYHTVSTRHALSLLLLPLLSSLPHAEYRNSELARKIWSYADAQGLSVAVHVRGTSTDTTARSPPCFTAFPATPRPTGRGSEATCRAPRSAQHSMGAWPSRQPQRGRTRHIAGRVYAACVLQSTRRRLPGPRLLAGLHRLVLRQEGRACC